MTEASGTREFHKLRNAEPDAAGLIERPVVPLSDLIIYPNVITPLVITTTQAKAAVDYALKNHLTIFGLAQLDPDVIVPEAGDLYEIGTEIALGNILPMSDRGANVLAQGRRRIKVVEVRQNEPFIMVTAQPLPEQVDLTTQTPGMMQTILELFKHVAELDDEIPPDVVDFASQIDEPGFLADLVTSTLSIPLREHQRVLEILNADERLQQLALLLGRQVGMLEMRDEINNQVQEEMSRGQREMYLREQMRIIQMELGEEDVFQQEINELHEKIIAAKLPPEVSEKADKELSRLAIMPPMAPEVGIIHTYLDWLVSLPWHQASEDNLDLANAQTVLDSEHYGLPKIKNRVLEHIAVRKLAADKMKSPILCFLGPPGVGKTSLGKSIARALGREFVRVSLGGVRDEAEIRGHRRTYIGALPGRIIQTIRRAGTVNPVFMLDEIDKLGTDFRGDPSSALLEVLDPEQNNTFSDHYLDVPYDLSKVMFITTANDLSPLPEALEDRLEVIEFSGYVEEEKLRIAQQFLIPKQFEAHGLSDQKVKFEAGALQTIIREYTYESGVRNLEREIANMCRKVARMVAENKAYPKRITSALVSKHLGPPDFNIPRANDTDSIGVVTGLVWTSAGGDIQTIEVSVVPGKGSLTLTGQLGDILQESAQAALSYMRARAYDLDVPVDDFENFDVHVHMPEGSVPKDGPSAGITLAAGIVSAYTERPIRHNFAMTGEITLRGKVLPVGGIKEKVLAARRAKIRNVILPALNKKDLVDIPSNALRDLNIQFVEDMQQVLDIVLLEPPVERQREREQREREKDVKVD